LTKCLPKFNKAILRVMAPLIAPPRYATIHIYLFCGILVECRISHDRGKCICI